MSNKKCHTRRTPRLPMAARVCSAADMAPRNQYAVEILEPRRLLSVSWTGGGDRVNWTDPANWGGQLPAASDDVIINIPGNPTIQLASGTQTIHSLISADGLKVTGGTLAVATTAQFTGNLNLAGGTLLGGIYSSSGAGSLIATAPSTIDGLALGSDLAVPSVTLHVRHGLTLNGSLTLLGAASVLFDDTQSCLGAGRVVFASPSANFGTGYAGAGNGPITLTIGPGITVHGAAGASAFDTMIAFSPDKIVNQGTISADVAGQTITLNGINGPAIVNQGTMSATAGTLHLINLQKHGGRGALDLGGRDGVA